MKQRVLLLTALWLSAVLIAIAAEWTLGRRATITEVVWAGLFLPLTAVVGGGAAFGDNFLGAAPLGLAFWPIWIVMSRRWLKNGPSLGVGISLELWMLVGFAQPLARFGLVMSA